VYSTSASSTAFSTRILSFPPLRSYAERSPPRCRMVVSKRLTWHPSVCVKSMFLSSARDRSYSSLRPIINSVSKASTIVAAHPQNGVLKPPAMGLNSSFAHACCLYPDHACKKASRTSFNRFSRISFSFIVSGTGSCWILGIFFLERGRGRWM
jgi:hypothetical protein